MDTWWYAPLIFFYWQVYHIDTNIYQHLPTNFTNIYQHLPTFTSVCLYFTNISQRTRFAVFEVPHLLEMLLKAVLTGPMNRGMGQPDISSFHLKEQTVAMNKSKTSPKKLVIDDDFCWGTYWIILILYDGECDLPIYSSDINWRNRSNCHQKGPRIDRAH